MKRKIISILMIGALSLTFLVGCGSETDNPIDSMNKAQLRETYNNLAYNYDSLIEKYDSLNLMYQALSTENLPSESISMTGDGTGRYTFNSVDSKIIFPASFQYPGTEAIQADGSINVVNNVSITPGSNWIAKLNGSTLEIEHSSGISGTIKTGMINSSYDVNLLQQDVLAQWFINVPESQVVYKDIFIDGNKFGVQATTPTMIDSENAFLRCGMLSYSSYSLTYIFVYRGDQDLTKDESIMNVINTISIVGNTLKVEG